jgi:hypothetical protein
MPVAVPGSRPPSVTTASPHSRPGAGRCRTSGPTGATAPHPGQRAPAPQGPHRPARRSPRAGPAVQPPGRLGVGPAVHRQRDQVRAVLEGPDDDAAGRPVRRPVVVRHSVPQRPGVGAPQPQAATGELVARAVGRPGQPDTQRGGSHRPRPRWSATRAAPLPVVPGAWSGCERAVGTAAGSSLVPGRQLVPQRQSTGDGRAVGPESDRLGQRAPPRRQPPGAAAGGTSGPGRRGGGRSTVRVLAVSGR